ncbi:HEPN domain-containing protein [Hahella sp. CR1]|uniref:HEPN domain-containing protein n=1 Tax=Hahella sp. CR1 TaxID=2992807 RepID=UPI0024413BB3|nr:HEPN domain-containing protein [Hahella sp. CR1]MDG9667162.1 HEPN domain-containing protein [Hahella sp. CR1]
MKEIIDKRLNDNIDRVRNMIAIYQTHLQGNGRGRRGHRQTDLLRAATVFLHASLEDFLRSLSSWKFPDANKEVINRIPLIGSNGRSPSKFLLGELVPHKGKKVEDLICESIENYLEYSNYNNKGDIVFILTSLGLVFDEMDFEFDALTKLMARRHLIVHRADFDQTGGRGNHRVKSISVQQVETWVLAVEKFGHDVLDMFDN